MASSSSGSSSSSSSSSSERDSAYRRFLREVPDMWPETEKNRRNHHADAALWEMLGQVDPRMDLPRIDYQKVGVREFHDEFIRPQRPVIIRGAMDDWKAMRRWRVDGVSRRYRDAKFHLRDNKNGPADYVTLPNLVRYSRENRHDDPMYLFDSHFAKAKATKGMLKDFRVPRYFREDLVAIIPEKHRESYRWILCGGQRSGSAIHTDPLGTSAWNALISGHKRWFLLPPHYTADQVGVKGFGSRHPPANWWKDLYPEKRKLKGAVECIQGPGEIIYVPGGWWHIVINLDVTFCVTQNFVSPNKASFDPAWAVTAKKRPRKARRWRKLLRSHFPEWADRVHKLKYRYASSSEGSSSCGSSGWTSIDELPTTDTDRDGPNASRRAASDSEASSISSSSSSDSSSSDDDSST
jgi:histone arginine demethylase JMJD6